MNKMRCDEWEALASSIKWCMMNSLGGSGISRGKCQRQIKRNGFNCSSPFYYHNYFGFLDSFLFFFISPAFYEQTIHQLLHY